MMLLLFVHNEYQTLEAVQMKKYKIIRIKKEYLSPGKICCLCRRFNFLLSFRSMLCIFIIIILFMLLKMVKIACKQQQQQKERVSV